MSHIRSFTLRAFNWETETLIIVVIHLALYDWKRLAVFALNRRHFTSLQMLFIAFVVRNWKVSLAWLILILTGNKELFVILELLCAELLSIRLLTVSNSTAQEELVLLDLAKHAVDYLALSAFSRFDYCLIANAAGKAFCLGGRQRGVLLIMRIGWLSFDYNIFRVPERQTRSISLDPALVKVFDHHFLMIHFIIKYGIYWKEQSFL